MKNENYRNFNVCGKATASQKEHYRKNNQVIVNTKNEKEKLVYYYCKESINQKIAVENKRKHNSKEVKLDLDKEIIQLKSVSNSFYQIGILAFIGTMFLGK
jgi:hypothetical protein